MIKGLALTPPAVGRISIGKVVERGGKRLPEKDDQFTITTQLQGREGWLVHPLDEVFRQAQGGKIRTIPVMLPFNDPDLNFRASYSLFDRTTGRPLCVGDGVRCKRVTEDDGVQSLPCPGPEGCPLAMGKQCKPYGRLNVVLETEDPWGTFVFRTTGFNSIRTLAARLQYFQAVSGDCLASLPLELRLRGKTTTQSHGTPIYFVDLTFRTGESVEQALTQAKARQEAREAAGWDQTALDEAARRGLANGTFEDAEEEGLAVVEEFFTEPLDQGPGDQGRPEVTEKPPLVQKLKEKVQAQLS
jgi:hypothetical protein